MITNKKIVLTGASSGIGKEVLGLICAPELGNQIIAASRSIGKMSGYGENVICHPCDLSTKEGIDGLFEKLESVFDKADIFIANAGMPYYEVYNYVDWERIQNIFNVNSIGPAYTYAKYLEHLNGREGHLVMTVSAMGEMAIPGYALYAATKFAMKGFQEAIRFEKPENLTFTCIYPVATETNFFKVGGGEIEAEKAFPVQTVDKVARAVVRGVEKQKKNIYPCKIYRPSKVLMNILPFVKKIYWSMEKKKLERFLKRKEEAAK
ncbi:MAG: SDR family NAD(P)-dependent oxidoreductase [Lachnospiraceae bacterium]